MKWIWININLAIAAVFMSGCASDLSGRATKPTQSGAEIGQGIQPNTSRDINEYEAQHFERR